MTLEPLLNIDQAAALSDLSPKTIERAIQRGELVASDLGEPGARRPTVRIEPDELRSWWERRRRARTQHLSASSNRVQSESAPRGRLMVTEGMGR